MLATLLSLSLAALPTVVFPAMASAAGTASVSISPSTVTVAAGTKATFTLSLSCSVTGGCANTTITLPVTTYTDLTGASVNDSAQFGALSCSGWTKSTTTSTVTYKYTGGSPAGTLPTGSSQCTFDYSTTNYTTPNNQTFALTPTINGSFPSATGNSATLTVTADRKLTFAKRATTSIVGGAVTKVGQGAQYNYVLHIDCPGDGAIPGAIGTKSLTVTDQLPANFTYQSYVEVYNANNGNFAVSPPATPFPGTVTTPNAGNNNTFTYSDPGGTTCTGANSNAPGRDIQITGTASTAGVPDATGSTITNSATATWTYLDGTPGTVTSTATTNVVSAVPDPWLSKGPTSQSPSNQGQYVYPPDGGAYQWYTYPGDWNGSGISAQYAINLATNGVAAGVDFAVQDPMPCQSNNVSPGTAANPNYASNAPGTLCTKPAFIPTRVIATGFTPTAADSVTVVHTDGTTATIAWDSSSQTWPIPTSPAVSEIDFPPFADEGANTSSTMMLIVEGYAAPDVLTTSLLTNTATGNAYLVGSNSPLTTQEKYSTSIMVVSATPPSGVVVQPGIWPRYNGGSTCTEVVSIGNFGGNGPQSNYVEVAQAPSKAFYLSYLAPAGATVTAGTTQTFTFTPRSFSFFPAGPLPGVAASTGAISAIPTPNYNGTGRTLLQWVIPAGTITTPGDYFFTGVDLTVDLGAGCAGIYQNDATVGYGGPITVCPPGKNFPPSKGTNNVLNTTNAPDPNNYCGVSQNITVAPTNPAFSVNKTVQGNLDPAPIGSGGIGNVSPTGGTATYQISFANTGQSNLTNPVMYDLLPRVGDTEATSNSARGSQFGVSLTGVGPAPAGVTVYYSTATNPCRPEVLPANPGCTDDWSTTPPATLGNTTALKFLYTGTVTVTGASGTHGFTVPFTVSTPNTTPGKVAWNTVGTNALAGTNLMGAAESSKTGLQAQVGPTITKATTTTGFAHPGDQINYQFTVTNNTAVTLTNVSVVDNLTDAAPNGSAAPSVSCSSLSNPTATCSGATTTLLPGQVANFVATQSVNQADVDYGVITDTATVAATPPTGGTLANTSNPVTVDATRTPVLQLVKDVSPTTVAGAGQHVQYSFQLTNAGNVTLTDLTIDEKSFSGTGQLGSPNCPQTTLAPNESIGCAADYVVTQADADAGSITNTAQAAATAPGAMSVSSNKSSATVTVPPDRELTLEKSAHPASVDGAGGAVRFDYTVTNTGNVTLENVAIDEIDFTGSAPLTDPKCPPTPLGPGESLTCTATYTVTQTDADAGTVSNTAIATGFDLKNNQTASDKSTATITVSPQRKLSLVKTVSPLVVNGAGATVEYGFAITNDGNVTVHDLGIQELDFTGHAAFPTSTICPSSVAPGETVSCTPVFYTLDQVDADAGSVTNTAVATGTAPGNVPVDSNSSKATVTITPSPELVLTKRADVQTVDAAGTTVTYTYSVTNTGNVTVTGLTVDESTFTGSGPAPAPQCNTTTLRPGDEAICTATYVVTQSDMNAGSIVNAATVLGVAPKQKTVRSNEDGVTITADRKPSLALQKSADLAEVTAAGQVINYEFAVENTGNVTLTGLKIDDSSFTGKGTLSTIACDDDELVPQAATTCRATYTVQQADLDAGTDIRNDATAQATAASIGDVSSKVSSAVVPISQQPGISLNKDASPTTVSAVGDHVGYTFTVTNTGNVTVSGIDIDEKSFSGSGTLSKINCPPDSIAPGDSASCSATYSVTQDDLDAGTITNSAAATAHGPQQQPATSNIDDATVTAKQTAALSLTKSADPTTAQLGTQVTYKYTVTNGGNVTLSNLGIDEESFSGSGPLSKIDCPPAPLLPGETTACEATYTITQDDVDAGSVTNWARATATGPHESTVTSERSDATVTVVQLAGIELVKKADPTVVHAAGDTVSYGFTVTNPGTVSLHDVAVTEKEFSGSGTLSAINCPGTTLAPHASLVCTATYRVTKQDVAAGVITNTAVATGVTGRAAAAGFAAIAPGTTVTSKASSARVIVEQPSPSPSPSGSGTSAPAGPTTSPSNDNDNDNEGVSTTGAAVIPLALLAGVLLIVGAGVLTVGRKRRHG